MFQQLPSLISLLQAIEEVDRDEVMSTSSGGDKHTEGSDTSEDGDGPYDFCGDEEVDKVYQFQKS